MAEALLELVGVGRRFPAGDQDLRVLKDIHLSIRAGEMVAIIGPSGSGKSTLMNLLGCLDRPSEGSYRIGGQETGALDSDALARLRREHFGFIFQKYHLLPHLDAAQNVEIPAVYAGVARLGRRARADQLLDRLGLSDRRTHKPGQLSGGQQQRVSIARALMNGGDVILADEPTGALDTRSGQELMGLLHELHSQGHTIILVTHDPQVASHAGRIIELSDGEIVRDQQVPGAPAPAAGGILARAPARAGQGGNPFQAAWGRFAEAFHMAILAMATHRMRTALTMLGIIIGITSVVSVVAIGQGARQKVVADISSMGTNVIDIYPGSDWGDDKAGSICTLVPADLQALEQQVYVDSATPATSGNEVLRLGNLKASAAVAGVGAQYFRVRGLELAEGSGFRRGDVDQQTQVVVVDSNTRKKLFPGRAEALGQILFIGSLPCRVIGVTRPKESPFGSNQNLEVWLPYSTAMGRLLGQHYFNSITVRIRDGVSNPMAEQNLIRMLQQRHGTRDFYTSSSDTILKTVQKTTATLTLLISAIAVISLLVGGIGVMNIMLVSVHERTHEIGIRMAVGARQDDILQQFLIEAVMVCLLGGLIGILLSYGVGLVFPLFVSAIVMRFSVLSIASACCCSSLIGVLFGFLPARNAARLDPIQALARE